MPTTKLYANKDGAKAQVAFMRLGTANGSDKVVRIQRGMQVLYEDWPTCTITANAEHTTGFTPATIRYGQPWSAVLVPDAGFCLSSVTVTMGDTDITSSVYNNGAITIPYVSGNVAIEVTTSSVTNTSMFTSRTTADGLTLLNNKALLKGIRGNTCIFTQFIPIGTTLNAKPDSAWGSFTPDSSQPLWTGHINGTASVALLSYNAGSTYVGHTLYYRITIEVSDTSITRIRFGLGPASATTNFKGSYSWYTLTNGKVTIEKVVTQTYNYVSATFYNASSYVWIPEDGVDVTITDFNVIDLSYIAGDGVITTAAQFKKLFPLGWYAKSSGIYNNKMTSYISKDSNDSTLQTLPLDITALTVNNGVYEREGAKASVTTGKGYNTTSVVVGSTWNYATSTSANYACYTRTVYAGEKYRTCAASSGSTWAHYVLLDTDKVVLSKQQSSSRDTPNVITIEQDGFLVVNFPNYNSETDYVCIVYTRIFQVGMKSSFDSEGNIVYDEIKKDNGIWKAYRRIGDVKTANATTLRNEYDILEAEEIYPLDNQNITDELIVATGGNESITPVNGTTPSTAPAIMEIQYGAEPSRELLGGAKGGGGNDEPEEYIDEYSEEPLDDEPKDDELDEPKDEPKEEEVKDEPKDESGEEPIIDDNPQPLKK